MNATIRPASSPVPTSQLVPASPAPPAAAAPTAAPVVAQPSRPRPASPTADNDQIQRDFYAWCAGCEGYGSIF